MNDAERAKLEALRDELISQRDDVKDRYTATQTAQTHRNGVACGMGYCIDEITELIEELDE